MRHRIFIAVNLPDDLKQDIVAAQNKLKKFDWPIAWVPADNLHLTVRFLGSITDEEIKPVKKIVAQAAHDTKPFQVTLNNYIVFPSLQVPRVIGLSVEHNEQLFDLHDAIAGVVEEQGIGESERFPFMGHITIGRMEPVCVNFRALTQLGFQGSFEVRAVEIMESVLTPDGPVYSIIQSFSLA